jgi:hypothetical protein
MTGHNTMNVMLAIPAADPGSELCKSQSVAKQIKIRMNPACTFDMMMASTDVTSQKMVLDATERLGG